MTENDRNENYARKVQENEDKRLAIMLQEQIQYKEESYDNAETQGSPRNNSSKPGGYKQFKDEKGKKKKQGKNENGSNHDGNNQFQSNLNQNSAGVVDYNFGNNQDDGFTFHQYDASEETKSNDCQLLKILNLV